MGDSMYDFDSDLDFFEEDYDLIVLFYKGKTVMIKNRRVVYSGPTHEEVYDKALALGVLGQCSIIDVTGSRAEDIEPVSIKL